MTESATPTPLNTIIVILDKQGIVVAVNEPWKAFAKKNTFIPREIDAVGNDFLSLKVMTSPEFRFDDPSVLSKLKSLIRQKRKTYATILRVTHNRQEKWFSFQATKLADSNGSVVSISDVTEKKDLETTVSESESRLEAILRNIPEGVLTVRHDFTIDLVSKVACDIFGYKSIDLVGQPIDVLVPPASRDIHKKHLKRFMLEPASHATSLTLEVSALHKDGRTFPIELSIAKINIGNKYFYTVVARDITERSRYLRNLTAAIDNVKNYLAVSGAMILRLSNKGLVEVINQRGLDLLEYEPEEIEEKNWFKIAVHPNDVDETKEAFDAAIFERGIFLDRLRSRVVTKTGKVLTFEWNTQLETGRNNEVTGFLLSGIDITEQATYERSLFEAKMVAEKANRSKSEFLSSMSHELRTPLNAITGFSEILASANGLSEKHRAMANVLLDSSRHLLSLVNDVLDLSSIEGKKINLKPESFSLSPIIKQCDNLTKTLAMQYDVKVIIGSSDENETKVYADKRRTLQVLLNLVSNAIKYNKPGGKVLIKTSVVNKMATISITDNGIGIARENLVRLFRPFERFGAEKTNITGTGIGLVITRRLIKEMGGRLRLYSVENRGTSFLIELPIDIVKNASAKNSHNVALDENDEQCDTTEILSRRFMQLVARRGDSLRILFVEDNLTNQMVMKHQMEKIGLTVEVADNGKQGYQCWKNQEYSLILTDIHMPEMNGIEFVKAVRASEKDTKRRTPIIVVSADVMSDEVWITLDAGADYAIAKPVELRALQQTLLKVLDEHSTTSNDTRTELVHETPVNDAPIFDESVLVNMIGHDAEAIRNFLGSFCEQTDAMVVGIEKIATTGDVEEIRQQAHKMKSSAAAVGAIAFSRACELLERKCKEKRLDEVPQFTSSCKTIYAETRQKIQNHLRT